MDQIRLSRSEILDRIQQEYDALRHLLDRLTADQMMQPDVVGIWSIKEVVAHLSYWNRLPVRELEAALQGLPARNVHDPRPVDVQNAEAATASHHDSLETVLAQFAQTVLEDLEAVQKLPDRAFEPGGEVEQMLGDSVSQIVNNNTYDHWQEHRDEIERWLATGETQ